MIDGWVALSGLLVGVVVGLTGMGGGALMTPLLVLMFGVSPLTAVSSDLLASTVMKPVGGAVHARRGTVHKSLVLWLMAGSIPSAVLGVVLLRRLSDADGLQLVVRFALGVALVVVAAALIIKQVVSRREGSSPVADEPIPVRRLATVVVGALGGLIVGMTSVGSGSLLMLMLIALYPRLRMSQLVGTDLVQAVPLVAAASLAHLFIGDVQLGLTASILVGALPGVYLGARLSSRAPDHWIRPVLVVVLLASGLKLMGAQSSITLLAVGLLGMAGVVASVLEARRLREGVAKPEVSLNRKTLNPSELES